MLKYVYIGCGDELQTYIKVSIWFVYLPDLLTQDVTDVVEEKEQLLLSEHMLKKVLLFLNHDVGNIFK